VPQSKFWCSGCLRQPKNSGAATACNWPISGPVTLTAECVVYYSGRLLSHEFLSHHAVSVPRPGQRHDERWLRFLFAAAAAQASP